VLATIPNLSNGQEAVAVLPVGNLRVSLRAAGTTTTVFGPVGFLPMDGLSYQFLAIGSLTGGSFGVEVIQRDLAPAVPGRINSSVIGWNCGPTISSVPPTFDFGQLVAVRANGGTPNAMAIVNVGSSSSVFAPGVALPLSLAPFGAPGCFLNCNVIGSVGAVTDATGSVTFSYTVPTSLFGSLQPFYFQIGTMTNVNALGFVATEALEIR
jgi:hypothetical protein